jgi:hypothetical protein
LYTLGDSWLERIGRFLERAGPYVSGEKAIQPRVDFGQTKLPPVPVKTPTAVWALAIGVGVMALGGAGAIFSTRRRRRRA